MNTGKAFSDSACEDQICLAERELAAFIGAVSKSFGQAQARLAAEDWLDESDLMRTSARSTSKHWRAVTIAASARLANRLTVVTDHRTPASASPATTIDNSDTKVLSILSSNCSASALLV
jgi:hypothetical protein